MTETAALHGSVVGIVLQVQLGDEQIGLEGSPLLRVPEVELSTPSATLQLAEPSLH